MRNVTVRSPQNAYIYAPRNLLIAYSLGCSITSVVVVFGLVCIHLASGSYTTTFSTIPRTTKILHLDTDISAAKTRGAEPLPERLAKTRIIFKRQYSTANDDASPAWGFSVLGGQSQEIKKMRRIASLDSLLQTNEQVQLSSIAESRSERSSVRVDDPEDHR